MNIIVTGASKGIGYEIVKKFSQNPENRILAFARSEELLNQLKLECNNNVEIYSIDFLSESFQTDFQKIINKHLLHFDIVINNAGHLINKPFLETSTLEIEQTYQINVHAPIFILQTIIPHLNDKNHCHIINIGSMGGFQGSSKFSGLSIYSSSKAALANLTECLAEEYVQKNITINCLALGSVQTEMLNKAFPNYQAQVSAQDMAAYIVNFSIDGMKYFNGKIIPISKTTP